MSPLIQLTSVQKTYPGPPRVTALRKADLVVQGGELVSIVGSSGSGKSTLLNIIGLLDQSSSGTVRLLDKEVSAMPDRQRTSLRAGAIGFVFQAFHLIPYLDSVGNVMVPLIHLGVPEKQRRTMAESALHRVGLTHRLTAKPATLSGGEQQRVAIARAVVHSPRLVLCDEPTGNLDQTNTALILNLLRGLVSPERAVVVVTHEQEVRDRSDRVVEVVDGELTG